MAELPRLEFALPLGLIKVRMLSPAPADAKVVTSGTIEVS